ncbi:MAG TPA: hypothetical protein VGE40_04485 [Bacilli bacterium]
MWTCKAVYRTWIGRERFWTHLIDLAQGWNDIHIPFKQLKDEANIPLPNAFFIHNLIVIFQEKEYAEAGKSALGSVHWVKS